jgi:phosphinothricin acetyltransferase
VHVRDAVADDVPAILDLYNATIATTTAAWTEHPETLAGRQAWFEDARDRGHAVLVAVEGGDVVGYCSLGEFRDTTRWPGYRFTAEHSVHVRQDRWGRGIGRTLMEALIERAIHDGLHVLVAAVDADNDASIRFHERLGFVQVAHMPETGWKFGRWLDLVLLQRVVGERSPDPSGPDMTDPSRPSSGPR